MTILPLRVVGLKKWMEGHFDNLPPKCPKMNAIGPIQKPFHRFIFSLSPLPKPIVGAFSTHAAVGERRHRHRSHGKGGAATNAPYEPNF